MKLLLIGATGGTGQKVISQALERGDQVVAYARTPQKLEPSDGLQVVTGQLDDAAALRGAMEGVEAVLVTLGPPASPGGMRHVDLMSRTLPLVSDAMDAAGVKRLVMLSALGVGDSERIGGPLAKVFYRTMLRSVYADKVRAEKQLAASDLDVTLVLPAMLTDAEDDPRADVYPASRVDSMKGIRPIGRGTVARVMLDAAHAPSTIGEKLVVAAHGSIWLQPEASPLRRA